MTSACIHIFGPRTHGPFRADPSKLGLKGAGLSLLARLRLPVPPGFIIDSTAAAECLRTGHISRGLLTQVRRGLSRLGSTTGRRFGDPDNPLLVSVRCSAPASMPGLMPAILNIGLNDACMPGLARWGGAGRFAEACDEALKSGFAEHATDRADAPHASDLPQDPFDQLRLCIDAAIKSWNSARAIAYRRTHNLNHLPSLAVVIQAMAFGDLSDDSATGSAFTRDPITGEDRLTGEIAVRSRDGGAVRESLSRLPSHLRFFSQSLERIKTRLERRLKDAQDFQFVIERGRLFVLSSRPENRRPAAALKIAADMVRQKIIDRRTAISRVDPLSLEQLLHPTFDPSLARTPLATGFPASPGAATGKLAVAAEEAQRRAADGEPVILVRRETDAADIAGMQFCEAILTSTGGMTSHAAVVARGMGTPCVTGASAIAVDEAHCTVEIEGRKFGPDDWISLDGSRGEIYEGRVPIVDAELGASFRSILNWADEFRSIRVLANADTPEDAELARGLGAQGIGLCRTEHMFFGSPQRLLAMRKMILAADSSARQDALDELLPHQRADFIGIFEAMNGLPVTIRLLDPPLHEFLPKRPADQAELARSLATAPDRVRHRIEQLREANPMLGHRGCRLAITYPEILDMQVRAIIQATSECRAKGVAARPGILIPLVMDPEELRVLVEQIRQSARSLVRGQKHRVNFPIGAMIEVPRAALLAGHLAPHVDFLSIGTNDLSQMTLGMSRDDVNGFLPTYLTRHILPADPFRELDESGVGQLIAHAIRQSRRAQPAIKIGVCGEHGGDPASIAFFARAGVDSVSCSPYRTPIARLAGAQL